jgi:alpha-tubulin suppressor-like RCC1 family protein
MVLGIDEQVSQVACGASHTLCLTKSGRVYQWGRYSVYSKKGQPQKFGTLLSPKLVEGLPPNVMATEVAAGSSHSLVLLENHQAYSWGQNLNGACGFGASNLFCTNEPT